jgi:hypothetical protein
MNTTPRFTVTQFENPPTGIPAQFGMFEGTFGCRVFYTKKAGRKVLSDPGLALPDRHKRRLRRELDQSPLAESISGLDELVAESPPDRYVI